jgi:hypothetical protein
MVQSEFALDPTLHGARGVYAKRSAVVRAKLTSGFKPDDATGCQMYVTAAFVICRSE